MRRFALRWWPVLLIVTLLGSMGASSLDAAPPYQGVKLYVEIDAGQNTFPFEWERDNIKKELGIEFEIVGLPFVGQYEKIMTEFVSESGAYDVVIFPAMDLGDFASLGFLEPLDEYAKKWDPEMNETLPVFRDPITRFGGKLYALNYDGDVHLLYYRKDLFEDAANKAAFKKKFGWDLRAPKTWDEYMQVAEFFNNPGKGFHGTAFYGKRGFVYAWFMDKFAGLGGEYFDEKTMDAAVNRAPGIQALELLQKEMKFCPPDVLSFEYDELKDAFLKGRIAMCIQWPCVGKKSAFPEQSTIVGKTGFTVVPGGRSYMPYSRILTVAADSKNREAAYRLIHYMTVPKISNTYVSNPECGEDPFAYPHFRQPELYKQLTKVGAAKEYLQALQANIEQGYPELNIPGAPRYLDLLDLYVSKVLSGELSAKQGLDACAKEWNKLTKSLGKDRQSKYYQDWIQSWRKVGIAK